MRFVLFLFYSTCFSVPVFAQEQKPPATPDTSESDWQFEAVLYDYILPHESDFLLPVFYADYKSWHAEVRYNYEDKNTASVFGGYRFETGDTLVFGFTPVVGFVFGNTSGIAPGLLLDLAYGKFDFYSESEYVIDFSGSENNFFYTWSELAMTPGENLRFGVAANRTRLYQTGREIQRGVFAQYSVGKVTGGISYFNPFSDSYFFIVSLDVEF